MTESYKVTARWAIKADHETATAAAKKISEVAKELGFETVDDKTVFAEATPTAPASYLVNEFRSSRLALDAIPALEGSEWGDWLRGILGSMTTLHYAGMTHEEESAFLDFAERQVTLMYEWEWEDYIEGYEFSLLKDLREEEDNLRETVLRGRESMASDEDRDWIANSPSLFRYEDYAHLFEEVSETTEQTTLKRKYN